MERQRIELAMGQLSRFHYEGQVSSKSQKVNPMDYHVWCAMLEANRKLKAKPKTIAELAESIHVIWSNLSQGLIDKMV